MKYYHPEIGADGQVRWYFPSQRVIVEIESLQSEQMTEFLWNFAIEAVILEVDEPKKGEVSNSRRYRSA